MAALPVSLHRERKNTSLFVASTKPTTVIFQIAFNLYPTFKNYIQHIQCPIILGFLLLGPRCNRPLGMQNGRIRLTQLSASSSWDVNHGPRNGRLHFRRTGSRMGAWCARRNDRYQFYQVDFGRAMRVVKIATQGRQDAAQWVTQYFVTYSQDGASFAEYKENSNRKVEFPMIPHWLLISCNMVCFLRSDFITISSVLFYDLQYFTGNRDQNSVVQYRLFPPIRARFVRIRPWGWYRHISMRVEFFGCAEGNVYHCVLYLDNGVLTGRLR